MWDLVRGGSWNLSQKRSESCCFLHQKRRDHQARCLYSITRRLLSCYWLRVLRLVYLIPLKYRLSCDSTLPTFPTLLVLFPTFSLLFMCVKILFCYFFSVFLGNCVISKNEEISYESVHVTCLINIVNNCGKYLYLWHLRYQLITT